LGEAEAVDTVEILWPSGAVSRLKNLSARQYHRIQEPDIKERAKREQANQE